MLPTYMVALTIFHTNDFKGISRQTAGGTTVENYYLIKKIIKFILFNLR